MGVRLDGEDGPVVDVTLKVRVRFDQYTMGWLEGLADKGREQGEIRLLQVDGMPPSFIVEQADE